MLARMLRSTHAALTTLPNSVAALSFAMVSHTLILIPRTATRPGWAVTAIADIFPGPPVAIAGAGPTVTTIFPGPPFIRAGAGTMVLAIFSAVADVFPMITDIF